MAETICASCEYANICRSGKESINGGKVKMLCCASYEKRKEKTNADRIRTMTDEELAWFIYTKTGCDHKCMHWKSKSCTDPDSMKVCGEVWLDWLKQESEDKP